LRQAEITVPVNLQHLVEFISITQSTIDLHIMEFHLLGMIVSRFSVL